MVLCTGSIAYDYILTFKGRFKEHILLDKTHILNLSFLVDDLQKRKGGVAGNYAYNLMLLGHPAAVLATAGTDAAEYRDWLAALGVDCRGLRLLEGEISATGFTTTDMDDNQLTGYYGGAMWRAASLGLDDGPPDVDAVIIGPNDPGAMKRLVGECRDRKVQFVFDPAHQLPMMAGDDVTDSANGAWITIGNDYELELIQERTGRTMKGMLELSEMVVTTLGRNGSRITTRDGTVEIPSAPSGHEVDPTGCGDAYRAGLVAGLLRGLSLDEAGRIASLAATYAVEHVGTIEHEYTREQFAGRYRDSFGSELAEKFWVS
ncbi:MAG TPA: carbohydrate kinase family protein, partial [Candidatus Dormibacteraeota bacterium]|nr:carbohydrate kinase family protein [Candidatus Dormibacteraeota bacterium]